MNLADFAFNAHPYDSSRDRCHLFYDWFCDDKALPRRAEKLSAFLAAIIKSPLFVPEATTVAFKNCCPVNGKLYDAIFLGDARSDETLYWLTLANGHHGKDFGKAELYSYHLFGSEPMFRGTPSELKSFFLHTNPNIIAGLPSVLVAQRLWVDRSARLGDAK